MACSFRTRQIFAALLAGVLTYGFGAVFLSGGQAWAEGLWGTRAESRVNEPLRVTSVQWQDADLVFTANRPFTENESRHLSLLRFPSPYRLVMDIPNARLESGQTVIPVGRNGVDRVELSESRTTFYSAVRAVVYLENRQALSAVNPVFNGNMLRMTGFRTTAPVAAALPPGRVDAALSMGGPAPRRADFQPPTPGRSVRPLPPVTQYAPAISTQRPQPPVPPRSMEHSPPFPPSIPQATVLGPAAAGMTVIDEVYFRDHRFYLKSAGNAELHIKNRFVLSEPTRLVLDVDNAVLRDRALTRPISGDSPEIRQIRVGQFDDKTVRIVIQTSIPEQFDAAYPGSNRALMAISPYDSASAARLSANTKVGELESIDLKRDNGGTVLRLITSTPMVHRFVKRNDRVVLELLNAASRPTPIGFDGRQYPELVKMRLEPLADGEPNSKLVLQLAGPGMRVVPVLSDNGRMLELTISRADGGGGDNDGGAALANLAGLSLGDKGPYPARIVLDAGHGGKDLGANRNGVNEKDLNLSLAMMVREALTARGFKVYMTRSTDVFLPLPQITRITNQVQPDLFISIHHNASVNSALNGIETYYYTPQSIMLARRVHGREINAVGARDGGVKRAMFYVIHHTAVPAILCEVGYVSNPAELNELQSYQRKQQTARAIADGVVDYLKTRISARAKK